jgi:hypothetical protein
VIQVVVPRVFGDFHALLTSMLNVSTVDILKQLSETLDSVSEVGLGPLTFIRVCLSSSQA